MISTSKTPNEFYLPQFNQYTNTLTMFGNLYALQKIWEITDLVFDHSQPSPYLDELIQTWERLTIDIPIDSNGEARKELDQFMRMASPVLMEDLYVFIKNSRQMVEQVLSRSSIEQVILDYNKQPDNLYKKYETDENTWSVINGKKHLLDPEHLEYFMENIVNRHLLPDFRILTDRVIRLFELGNKTKLLLNSDSDSFEAHIDGKDKFKTVIEVLIQKKIIVPSGSELHWKGIGRSNLGAVAALARYLEKAEIMRDFTSMTHARKVYCEKFNITQTDQKEWNKKYDSQEGIRFDVVGPTEFREYFGFILEL